jgi:REP element-mobilizing transposase RayT
MSRPLRIEYPGAFYHVTSRGNEQKDIFKSDADREQFLFYLSASCARYGTIIHAYCLMTNHYHLMLETPFGDLALIMKYINSSYTTYFNVKRKRVGHLLQGRYKAILVEADSYAAELSRYMHLNPVRAGMVKFPEDYIWSSYRFYANGGEPAWLTTGFILDYFGAGDTESRQNYRRYVNEKSTEEYTSPLIEVVGSTILGSDDFVREIREKELSRRTADRDLPTLRELQERAGPEMISGIAREIFADDSRLARFAGIYLCHRYSGAKLKEIGDLFLVSYSGVTQASRRFEAAMETDGRLREKIEEIKGILNL